MAQLLPSRRNTINLIYQLTALLSNRPIVVKLICLTTILGYLLSFSATAVRIFSVTPGLLLPPAFWIWTTFTSCFLEFYFYEVLVDIVTTGLCGKLIEPVWGQVEMIIFFGIINFGATILTAFFYLLVFVYTNDRDILFDVYIHGLAGYIAGLCVAVKQIMPDLLLAHTPIGRFTNKSLPMTILLSSSILWLTGLIESTYPTKFCFGIMVSWLYLRFFQLHKNGQRGDGSENFSFSSLFPNILQLCMTSMVKKIYHGLRKIRIIKKQARNNEATFASVNISLPPVDPCDMERKHQVVLEAPKDKCLLTNSSTRVEILTTIDSQQDLEQINQTPDHQTKSENQESKKISEAIA